MCHLAKLLDNHLPKDLRMNGFQGLGHPDDGVLTLESNAVADEELRTKSSSVLSSMKTNDSSSSRPRPISMSTVLVSVAKAAHRLTAG